MSQISIAAPSSTSAPWNHIFTIRGVWSGTGYDKKYGENNVICEVARRRVGSESYANGIMNALSNSSAIYFYDDTVETAEEFKEKYAGKYIAYETNFPTSYSLTPTELQTLIGQNNIWSNADRVEVEYDLAESNDELYRRRNIILNTPHIETVAGSIASFKTDVHAPLKKCKVHFSPVQEGTGDPSPDNVRAINGWTGVEVTRCGKNLYNPDSAWQKNGRLFKRFTNHVECFTSFTVKDDSLTNNVYFGYAYTPEHIELGYNWMIENGVIGSGTKVNRTRSGRLPNPEGANALCDYFTIYPGTDAAISQLNAKWQIQTELGTTPTAYEPYQGQTFTLDWTDEAGTVYGGHVDLVTGEVWKTWDMATSSVIADLMNRGTATLFQSGKAIRCYCPDNCRLNSNWTVPCTHFSDAGPVGNWSMDATNKDGYIVEATGRNVMFIASDLGFTTKQEWAQWVIDNNVQYAYPLQTSELVGTISTTIFKTLRGANNIWSNTNSNIELSYWKH